MAALLLANIHLPAINHYNESPGFSNHVCKMTHYLTSYLVTGEGETHADASGVMQEKQGCEFPLSSHPLNQLTLTN